MIDDGFNERTNYIHNSVDQNKINNMGPSNLDSSFAEMNVNSHKNDVKTVDTDVVDAVPEVKGDKENFVLRNSNMENVQENMKTLNTANMQINNKDFMFRSEKITNLKNAFRK